MKLKNLVRSYSFWTALAGALVILINSIGNVFGFHIEEKLVSDIVMAVAGVLVAFGVVTLPASTKDKTQTSESQADQSEAQSESEAESKEGESDKKA